MIVLKIVEMENSQLNYQQENVKIAIIHVNHVLEQLLINVQAAKKDMDYKKENVSHAKVHNLLSLKN